MTKKKSPKRAKTEELSLGNDPGVVGIRIEAIDSAASTYEKQKDRRCAESPKELAAKASLRELMHKHREELSRNEDGDPFYRYEGADYTLTEKLKRSKADDGEVRSEEI